MQSDNNTDTGNQRLIVLRVLMKGMLLLALLASAWVMLRSMSDSDTAGAGGDSAATLFSVRDIAPGQVQFFDWQGRPIVVARRPAQWQAWLREADESLLLDPHSERSQQPRAALNSYRSALPEWFVAVALGTDLGCTLEYLPASNRLYQREPWRGGFVDTCRKSRYDMAGRVFRAPFATANLVVPPWQLDEDAQTISVRQ